MYKKLIQLSKQKKKHSIRNKTKKHSIRNKTKKHSIRNKTKKHSIRNYIKSNRIGGAWLIPPSTLKDSADRSGSDWKGSTSVVKSVGVASEQLGRTGAHIIAHLKPLSIPLIQNHPVALPIICSVLVITGIFLNATAENMDKHAEKEEIFWEEVGLQALTSNEIHTEILNAATAQWRHNSEELCRGLEQKISDINKSITRENTKLEKINQAESADETEKNSITGIIEELTSLKKTADKDLEKARNLRDETIPNMTKLAEQGLNYVNKQYHPSNVIEPGMTVEQWIKKNETNPEFFLLWKKLDKQLLDQVMDEEIKKELLELRGEMHEKVRERRKKKARERIFGDEKK